MVPVQAQKLFHLAIRHRSFWDDPIHPSLFVAVDHDELLDQEVEALDDHNFPNLPL